jgi:hypothetical protein
MLHILTCMDRLPKKKEYVYLTRSLSILHNWKYLNRNNITSFQDLSQHTFNIKILNDALPVITNMKIRHDNKYTKMTCPSCSDKDEDFAHLHSCKSRSEIVNAIVKEVSMETLQELGQFKVKVKVN